MTSSGAREFGAPSFFLTDAESFNKLTLLSGEIYG